MKVKEFEEALQKLKEEYANVDDMEIGPVFYNCGKEVIMMVQKLTIIKDGNWSDGGDAVGFIWSC